MIKIRHIIYDYLVAQGVEETTAEYLNMLALTIGLLIVIFVIDFIIRRVLLNMFNAFAKRTKSNFDDILVSNKVPRNIAHIIPLMIAIEFAPVIFSDFDYAENIIEKGLKIFAIILTLWIVRSILNAIRDYLKTLEQFKDKPIASYIQVFMIFAWGCKF